MKASPAIILKTRGATNLEMGKELDKLTYNEIAHKIDPLHVRPFEAHGDRWSSPRITSKRP